MQIDNKNKKNEFKCYFCHLCHFFSSEALKVSLFRR